jgi:hypothetical protein
MIDDIGSDNRYAPKVIPRWQCVHFGRFKNVFCIFWIKSEMTFNEIETSEKRNMR